LFLFVQVNALNLKTQPFQQRVSDVKPVKQSCTAVSPMASSHQTGSPRPPGNNIVEINNNSTAGFYFYIFLVYVWVNTWMEFVASCIFKPLLLNFPVSVEGYSIFVANLPMDATVDELTQAFSKFGAIKPNGVQVRSYKVGLVFILVNLC